MASTIFSGSSRYANDFSQVIERSLSLAALPLTQLGNERTKLTNQSTALNELATSVSSLRNAFDNVGISTSAIRVSTSDGAVLSASAETTALPGAYTVQVVSTGSRSTAASKSTLPEVTNYLEQSLSTADTFKLTVGDASYTISPKSKTLASLAEAINADPSYGAQAVLVNLGSVASPDYRLSLQSAKLGAIPMQLEEIATEPQTLLAAVSEGSAATYRINGQPSGDPISSDTASQLAIAPGVKIDLLKTGLAEVVVSRDTNKMTSALAGLAAAYNKLMTEVDKGRGSSNGPLNAHSILSTIAQTLRRVTDHTSTGTVKSFEQLGFSFSDSGVLSFDSAKFESVPASAVAEFLGSKNEGGMLGRANEFLGMIDSASTGLLPTTQQSIRDRIAETERQVSVNQERIELLKQRLADEMAAADALIGQLEQQVSYMNGLFEAMRINAQS